MNNATQASRELRKQSEMSNPVAFVHQSPRPPNPGEGRVGWWGWVVFTSRTESRADPGGYVFPEPHSAPVFSKQMPSAGADFQLSVTTG